MRCQDESICSKRAEFRLDGKYYCSYHHGKQKLERNAWNSKFQK